MNPTPSTPGSGAAEAPQDHDCPMARTYATVDCENYCGHPSHYGPPPYPDYSEYWDADICGNCGIPVGRHGGECGRYLMQPRDERGRFARICPDCTGHGLMNALAACRSCDGRGILKPRSATRESAR